MRKGPHGGLALGLELGGGLVIAGLFTLPVAWAQKPGGTLRISRTLVNQGIINPQGGVIDLISNSLTNQGTLTGFGTYKAKEIVNDGRALFQGGQVNFQSTYINNAGRTTEVALASASFFGAVTPS